MKRTYFVIYLTADGKCYDHSTVSAASFAQAYKDAKSFSKNAGLTLMAIIEKETLLDNFNLPDF